MTTKDSDTIQDIDKDRPWTDAELMRRLYVDEWNSSLDIAELLGCSKKTILNWLDKHGIDTRPGRPPTKPELADKHLLCEWYYEMGLTYEEIADRLDVSYGAVSNAMGKYGIYPPISIYADRRGKVRRRSPATYYTNPDGREVWTVKGRDEDTTVLVHRLVAVAEYGVEEVAGKAIHHRNEIPWDNRPKNLEPVDHGVHTTYHKNIQWGNIDPDWMSDPQYHTE